jgi:hypothetical protein
VSGAAAAEAGEDLTVRANATLRYNLGQRVERQDEGLLANPGIDDGNRNFRRGSLVNNRIDLLVETDVLWREQAGARFSAAAWYDDAYKGSLDNTNASSSNHLSGGVPALGLSPYTRRYYNGASGEMLDAFVFGAFEVAGRAVHVRAGQLTLTWGEALLGAGAIHGISYAQAPLDQAKAFSSPGVEAKELYRPLAQLSGSVQLNPELSLSGQYFLEWEATRAPESGSYLGASDALQFGGESLILGPDARALRGRDIVPKDRGDWGVAVRWSPEWLQGTAGLYWRSFSDRTPQLILNSGPANEYLLNYGSHIQLLGISLARQLGEVSVGFDVNVRRNMPLVSQAVAVGSGAAYPERGELLGARGKTLHAVLNATGSLGPTGLSDDLAWSAELTWSRWMSVSGGEAAFKGRPGYTAIDRVSKQNLGVALNVAPLWYQAFPGINLSLPVTWAVGVSGNSAVAGGGNNGAGSWSGGMALDLYSRHRVELKYVDYFGRTTAGADGSVVAFSGASAVLSDRGAVYFTVKSSF